MNHLYRIKKYFDEKIKYPNKGHLIKGSAILFVLALIIIDLKFKHHIIYLMR